jgi:hypothetical protein
MKHPEPHTQTAPFDSLVGMWNIPMNRHLSALRLHSLIHDESERLPKLGKVFWVHWQLARLVLASEASFDMATGLMHKQGHMAKDAEPVRFCFTECCHWKPCSSCNSNLSRSLSLLIISSFLDLLDTKTFINNIQFINRKGHTLTDIKCRRTTARLRLSTRGSPRFTVQISLTPLCASITVQKRFTIICRIIWTLPKRTSRLAGFAVAMLEYAQQ